MMKDAIYGGVNAAVVTAMNDDLSIDLDRMAAHSRWLLANGCNGLGVLGTTGEAASLGVQERVTVLDGLVARGIAPDAPGIAGGERQGHSSPTRKTSSCPPRTGCSPISVR